VEDSVALAALRLPIAGGVPSYTAITFDKSFNTYHWIGRAFYTTNAGPYFAQLRERYHSSVIRSTRSLVSDENTFDLLLKRELSSTLQASLSGSSFLLSDEKSIRTSNVASQIVLGGIEYRPMSNILFEPRIGFQLDRQIDRYDRGMAYRLGGNVENFGVGGYETNVRGALQYAAIAPRVIETDTIALQVRKTFVDETANVLRAQYVRNRRDFYFATDAVARLPNGTFPLIEQRAEDGIVVTDSLRYSMGRSMLLTFTGNVFNRDITRALRSTTGTIDLSPDRRAVSNTGIGELRIDGGVHAMLQNRDGIGASVGFYYSEREERHRAIESRSGGNVDSLTRIQEQKNNVSHRTMLASTLDVPLFSSSHTLSLAGSGSILRYDTPSMLNTDDRDELWYALSLTTTHRINQHMEAQIIVEANLVHLVYLSSQRSADNTWNRILRLSPRLVYVPSASFRTTNRFEVLANYTAYDFEFPASPIRSFAFRQFAFVDSTSWELTRRVAIEWFSHVRIYERGEFRWDTFSERPSQYFEDKTYLGTVRYGYTERLAFSVGIRYFSQQRFGYPKSDRSLEYALRSVGPTTAIVWKTQRNTALAVQGWYERQTQTQAATRGIVTVSMSLSMQL
jgi:hypothetical protein